MVKYHMDWIFIRTKPGNRIGRIMQYSSLKDAKEMRSRYIKEGYRCSPIGKWKSKRR